MKKPMKKSIPVKKSDHKSQHCYPRIDPGNFVPRIFETSSPNNPTVLEIILHNPGVPRNHVCVLSRNGQFSSKRTRPSHPLLRFNVENLKTCMHFPTCGSFHRLQKWKRQVILCMGRRWRCVQHSTLNRGRGSTMFFSFFLFFPFSSLFFF